MKDNKIKAIIIDELRPKYALKYLLKGLNISKSSYIYAKKHLDYKNKKDYVISQKIIEIYNENYKKYGLFKDNVK